MARADFRLSASRPLQIGLIVLQSDETIEADFRRLLPDGIEMLVSRVPSGTEVTPDSLQAMAHTLTGAASLFPKGANLAAVGYGCTSGTAQIGAETVADRIRAGARTMAVTEPVSALLAACRALGLRRIGVLTPYVAAVADRLCAVLDSAGIAVTAIASFDEAEEAKVARIDRESILRAARNIGDAPEVDGLFLSCTNLRTLDAIAPLETAIGKPVLSSNQVLAWHLLELVGSGTGRFAPGRLWTCQRPSARE